MSRTILLAVGILITVTASMVGLVLIPHGQFSQLQPLEITAPDGTVSIYPAALDEDLEAPGREAYRSLGCMYCHTQQVRPEGFGGDLDRGWGTRRSVPRDYVRQDPPYLGTMRTGPDLANIGERQPDRRWHYLHLFDPQITSPGSVMPRYPFLFELHRGKEPVATSYALPEGYLAEAAWIVPTEEGRALVNYLRALRQQHEEEVVR